MKMPIEIPKITKLNSNEHFNAGIMYALQGQLCTVLGISKDSPKFLQFIKTHGDDISGIAENNPKIKELIEERKFLTASQEIIKELNLEEIKDADSDKIRLAA